MFLGWIAREGLLVPETGADPLAVYSPDARKAVCRAVVSDVAASPARLLAATATEPQLAWCLACLGHALTLPLAPSPGELAAATAAAGSSNSAKEAAHQALFAESSQAAASAGSVLTILEGWLLGKPGSKSKGGGTPASPAWPPCVSANDPAAVQRLKQRCIGLLTLMFEADRSFDRRAPGRNGSEGPLLDAGAALSDSTPSSNSSSGNSSNSGSSGPPTPASAGGAGGSGANAKAAAAAAAMVESAAETGFTAQLALGQRALSILESALRVANAQPPLLPLPSVFFSSSPPVGPSASVPLASGAPDRQHSSLQQQQQQPQQQQLNHVGFDHATWHWLLRATLGLCDRLLVLPERRADNKLGDALALRVTHLALGAHLASLQHVGLNKASWRLLASYVTRWAHRLPVVSSWHACLASASTLLLRQLKTKHAHLAKQQAREHVLAQKKWRRGDRQGERKGEEEGDQGGEERGTATAKLVSSHRSSKKDEKEATAAVLLFWPLNSTRKAGNRTSFVNSSSSSAPPAPGGNAKKATRSTGGSSDRKSKGDDGDEDFLLNGYYCEDEEVSEGEDASVLAEDEAVLMVSLSPSAVHFLWLHVVHFVGNPNRLRSPFDLNAPFSATTSLAIGPLTATAVAAGAVAAKPPPSNTSASKKPGTDATGGAAAGAGAGASKSAVVVASGGTLAPPKVHRAALVALAHLCTMMVGDADALGFHPAATAASSSATSTAAGASARLKRRFQNASAGDLFGGSGKRNNLRNGIGGSVSAGGALAPYNEDDEDGDEDDEEDGDEEEASATVASAAAAAAALTYVAPHVNTMLRLIGGWLFDAALNPDPAYSPGRSVAILALGKLIVPPRRHGGRPPLLWPLSASPLFTDCALVTAKARITDPAVRAATASVSTSGEDNKDSSVSVPSSSSSSSTMSAKIAAPHVARFLLVLRLALTTEAQQRSFAAHAVQATGAPASAVAAAKNSALVAPATPETVVAALRGAGALLGADLGAGSRVLLESLNAAMSVVLAAHNAPPSPTSPSSFSYFLEHYAVNGSASSSSSLSAMSPSSLSSATIAKPPTARALVLRQRRQALGNAPYPLSGWLTEHLQVEAAVSDGPGQRSWCLAALATQVALGAYFDPAHATSNPSAAASSQAASSRSGVENGSQVGSELESAPLNPATLLGKKMRAKVVTLLEQVLIAVGRSSALDRTNAMVATWQLVVALHDACGQTYATAARLAKVNAGVAAGALAAAAHTQATTLCGAESPLVFAWQSCVLQPFLQDRLWPYATSKTRPLACMLPLDLGHGPAGSSSSSSSNSNSGSGSSSDQSNGSSSSSTASESDTGAEDQDSIGATAGGAAGAGYPSGKAGIPSGKAASVPSASTQPSGKTAGGGGRACQSSDLDVPCTVVEALMSLRLHAPLLATVARPAVRRWLHQVVTFVLRLACWHEPLSASPVAIHAARTAASSLTINVEEVSAASMSSSSSSAGVSGAVGTGAGGGAGTSGNKSGSAKGSASSTQAGSVLAKAAADALEIAANVAEQSNSSGGFGNNSASSGSGTSSSHNDPGANSTNSNSGAEMGVSGNDGSYLVALDAYVAARVGMIGRGIGYDLRLSRAMLQFLSPSAAAALATALECLRCWCLDAPWVIQPSSDTSIEEAEACRVLSDALSSAALISGAFVAPRGGHVSSPSASASRSTAGATRGAASSSSSLVELVAGLPPVKGKVACLATQLLESMHKQVGHYPLGYSGNLSSSGGAGGAGGSSSTNGYGSIRRKAGHALVSSRVNERSALQAFASSSARARAARGQGSKGVQGVPDEEAEDAEAHGECGGDDDDVEEGIVKAQRQLCRYVLVNQSTLVTLVEFTQPCGADDRLVVITRDGLNRRSFVTACLDLVNPRHPQIAARTHRAAPSSSSTSSSGGSSDALSLDQDSFGITLVAQTTQLVTSPIARSSSMHASMFNGLPGHSLDENGGSKSEEGAVEGGVGSVSNGSEGFDPAGATAPGVDANSGSKEAELLNPFDALAFVADPLLMRLAAQPHLLPRTGRLAPNDHLLLSDSKTAATNESEEGEKSSDSGTIATTTDGGGLKSIVSSSGSAGRYSLVALEASEAALLEELLPLPKPTGSNGNANNDSGGSSRGDDGGGDGHLTKNDDDDNSHVLLRRRGYTLTASQAYAEDRAAATAFAPAVPPSRAFLLPPSDLATSDHKSNNSGSSSGRKSGSSGNVSGGSGSDSGGAASYKSRLFMNAVLGATAADAPGRLTYLDGGGGASAEGLERGLEALDVLPERDTHVVWLLFARDRKNYDFTSAANSSSGASSASANVMKGSHSPLPPIEIMGRDGAWWATSQSFVDAASASAVSAGDPTGDSSDPTGSGSEEPTGSGGGVRSEDSAATSAVSSTSPLTSKKAKKKKKSYSVAEAVAARAAGVAWAQAELPPDWHVFLAGAAEETLNTTNSSSSSGSSGSSGAGPREREGVLGTARCGIGLGQAMDPARHLGRFSGGVDLSTAATLEQPLLYWADSRDEVVFLDTTRPLALRPIGSGPEAEIHTKKSSSSSSVGGSSSGDLASTYSAAKKILLLPVMDAFMGSTRSGKPLPARTQMFSHLAHPAVTSTLLPNLNGSTHSGNIRGGSSNSSSSSNRGVKSGRSYSGGSSSISSSSGAGGAGTGGGSSSSLVGEGDQERQSENPMMMMMAMGGAGGASGASVGRRRSATIATGLTLNSTSTSKGTSGSGVGGGGGLGSSNRSRGKSNTINDEAYGDATGDDDDYDDAEKPTTGGEFSGRVVVLWNECSAQFEPHDKQWALYGLGGMSGPMGDQLDDENNAFNAQTVGLYIIIDPLSDGLYRTRLYAGNSSRNNPEGESAGVSSMGGNNAYAFGTNCSLLGPLSHGMVVPLRLLGPLVRATSVNACRALANHQQARRSTKLGAPSLAAVAAISAKSSSTNSGTSARFGSGGSGPSGQANDALSLVPWSCPYEARALAIAKLALYKARPSSLHATSSSSAASTTATTPTAGAAGAASPNSFFSSTHSTQVLAAHLQATLAPQDPRAAAAAAEAAAQAEMERQSSADALFPAGKEHAKRAISLAGGSSIYSKASGMQAVHRV